MRTNIAIVGNYVFTMGAAPFDDPSWDIWAIGTNANILKRWDRCHEIHDMEHTEGLYGDIPTWAAGWKYLQDQPPGKPIYMQKKHPKVPASVEYPLKDILRKFGRHLWWAGRVVDGVEQPPNRKRPYPFVATACYQLAQAIDELTPKVRKGQKCRIGLWGIDMTGVDEYDYQKPAVWSLVGFAMGRGIDVIIPEVSSIMKCRALYGYEPDDGGIITAKLAEMRTDLLGRVENADELQRHRIYGGLNMVNFVEREFA